MPKIMWTEDNLSQKALMLGGPRHGEIIKVNSKFKFFTHAEYDETGYDAYGIPTGYVEQMVNYERYDWTLSGKENFSAVFVLSSEIEKLKLTWRYKDFDFKSEKQMKEHIAKLCADSFLKRPPLVPPYLEHLGFHDSIQIYWLARK